MSARVYRLILFILQLDTNCYCGFLFIGRQIIFTTISFLFAVLEHYYTTDAALNFFNKLYKNHNH